MQIADNLKSNAIKFTLQNGNIAVSFNLTEEEDQNILKINVKDMGHGLSSGGIATILQNATTFTNGNIGKTVTALRFS